MSSSPPPSLQPSAPSAAPAGDQALLRERITSLVAPPEPSIAGAGAAAVATRPRFAWMRPATLLAGSAVLLALDLALAITPRLTLALTALETLLVPVWIVAVISLSRRRSTLAGGRFEAAKPRIAVFLLVLGLLLACIVEKWLLLRQAAWGGGERIVPLYRTYTMLAFVLANAGLLGRRPVEHLLSTATEHPARLMVVSFGVATLLGSFLLTLPQSLRDISSVSYVDGVFMAASAVCVTGLTVHNVPETYTPFGQAVLLLLVQAGGLGIMVLSTFFAILSGRKLRLRDAAVMAEMIDADSFARLRRNVASIVLFTLGIEAVGALALLFCFLPHYEIASAPVAAVPLSGAGDHLWAAVFHSVSAYCNAGFSLFHDGFVPLVGSPAICSVIMALGTLGGLGFPVHDELLRWARFRVRGERPPRLSLHSRVVLVTSGILIALGAAGFLLLEARRSMEGLSWPAKVLASVFQSSATRSTGFNTVDFGVMGPATWMFTCALMFIGAAPGSTGGGIKVTTFAALFATLRAELRGYEAPRLLGRTLPAATVRRALGVAFLSVVLAAGFVFLLLVVEPHPPMRLTLEAISAFATTGLSTGVTPSLSATGKLLITVAMLIGRIGPLTLALALANQSAARSYRLPEERVGIG